MNDIQTVTHNLRLHQWAAIIQDRQASGLKIEDYCSEHNISRNAYYYWLRKVKAAAIESSGNRFAKVNPSLREMCRSILNPDVHRFPSVLAMQSSM